jgi:Uncharacterised nucleotidyltransferase
MATMLGPMSGDRPSSSVPALFLGAGLRAMLIDRVTAEVHGALAQAGIPAIVLKGPAIGNWLYGPDEVRGYGDTDLLIPHREWQHAGEVLESLGFQNFLGTMAHPRMESYASDPWFREGEDVDLHSTIYGLRVPHEQVWGVLSAQTVPMAIGGADLPVLAEPARAMHVALHAAQHQDGKAVYDLQKAVAQLPEGFWEQAADVAERLDGLPAFAAGLRLDPDGAAIVERLGLSRVRSTDTELRAGQVPLAESLNELLETRGAAAKLRLAWAELVPRQAFMRWWSPLARRGRLGMILAYVWRPLYILLRAPAAIRAVWIARRDGRSAADR